MSKPSYTNDEIIQILKDNIELVTKKANLEKLPEDLRGEFVKDCVLYVETSIRFGETLEEPIMESSDSDLHGYFHVDFAENCSGETWFRDKWESDSYELYDYCDRVGYYYADLF